MRRPLLFLIAAALVAAGCAGTADETTTTAGEPADTTTTTATETTTTTVAETTTTTAVETTTTAQAGFTVPETSVSAPLAAYNDGGEALFPSGSVEAHWYQSGGYYLVVYRGYDASAGQPMCPGNSIYDGAAWVNVTNSPINATVDEVCSAAPTIAEAPMGAYACGPLLYYLTAIPVVTEGYLYGTLEIATAEEVSGHTSQVLTNAAGTPEFEVGLTAYDLPTSAVEDAYSATC